MKGGNVRDQKKKKLQKWFIIQKRNDHMERPEEVT